jgi:hypothetical protein
VSQRALARASRVFSIGLPTHLATLLRAQRIRCIDLSSCFEDGRTFTDAYLDIAEVVLQQAVEDPPVALLTEGNPLLSNALNRFLVTQARERQIAVQVLPAVSPIDTLICQVGLDVGSFGLQVFDARRLVQRRMPVQPGVPMLLLQLAGVAAGEGAGVQPETVEAYRPLVAYLGTFYPPGHPIVHLANSGDASATQVMAAPLSGFDSLTPHIGPASTLFVDRLRQPAGS